MAEGGVPYMYSCIICGQEDLTEQDMKSHLLLEHIENSVCCPFCDIQCSSIEEAEDHLYSEHIELLSPNKRRNGNHSDTSEGTAMEITNCQQKTPLKKGKKAPYVNLEYFNKTLVDMPKDVASSKRHEIPVQHIKSDYKSEKEINSISRNVVCKDSYKTDIIMTDSENVSPLENNMLVNAETGEKMYMLPVLHVTTKPDSSLLHSKSSSLASKRARLSLDVTPCSKSSSSGETSSSTSSGSDFHCPLCKFSTSSESEIQRHVNVSHLDVLSPAVPSSSSDKAVFNGVENGSNLDTEQYMEIIPEGEPMPSTSHMVYECPICTMHHDSSLSLELHVNSKHADVLSPGVSTSQSESLLAEPTTVCDMDDGNQCPVCGVKIANQADMVSHVEDHFLFESNQHKTSSKDQDIARNIASSEMDNQLSTDAALAEDLHKRELLFKMYEKDLEDKDKQALQINEEKEFEKLKANFGMDDKNNYRKQYVKSLEKAVYKGEMTVSEYYTHKSLLADTGINGIDDGHSCTKDIIEKLEKFYVPPPSNVCNVWLCSETSHYAASHGDKGWGCGYRNLQMILSSLANQDIYLKVLFNGRPLIPSIPKMQRLIEAAWQKGFDVQGAEELGKKLVNTSKWIGATEITATLLSLGIKCDLIDFHRPTGPNGTHPELLDWVLQYFKQLSNHKPPLYLQHHGHSRTIIGIEEMKDKSLRLLLFDPSCSKRQMEQLKREVTTSQLRMLRRTTQSLKAKQYQIVAVRGILEDQDYEVMKTEQFKLLMDTLKDKENMTYHG